MFKYLVNIILLFALLTQTTWSAPVNVIASRVWPAVDYTRITIEVSSEVSQKITVLKNPHRLVLDLENIEINQALKSLPASISPSDPYIRQIRIGNFKPGVVRLAIDLKTEVNPKVVMLQPAGGYQHRLVLDVYPLQDPLLNVLNQLEKPVADSAPSANPTPSPIPSPATVADALPADPLPVPE
ncbi:MAG: AMIN domain-containing protein, partial [Methylophilaceae bacterium]